jgi:hypothetical protein
MAPETVMSQPAHAPEATDPGAAIDEVARHVFEQGHVETEFASIAAEAAPEPAPAEEPAASASESTLDPATYYREAIARTLTEMDVFGSAVTQYVRVSQRLQEASLEAVQRAMEQFGQSSAAMFRSGSPIEVAQLQQGIYCDAVTGAVSTASTMLQILSEAAQEGLRSLSQRAA